MQLINASGMLMVYYTFRFAAIRQTSTAAERRFLTTPDSPDFQHRRVGGSGVRNPTWVP
jgi:hypothetical protein